MHFKFQNIMGDRRCEFAAHSIMFHKLFKINYVATECFTVKAQGHVITVSESKHERLPSVFLATNLMLHHNELAEK